MARVASLTAAQTTELVDTVTIGRVERFLDGMFAAPCVDALTDLIPMPYMTTRIGDLWAEGRLVGEQVRLPCFGRTGRSVKAGEAQTTTVSSM